MDWNNTEEVKKKRALAIQTGIDPAVIDKFIQQKRNEYATGQLAQQGVVDIADIAKTNPQQALQLSQQGVTPKGSAEEQKQSQKLQDVIAGVNVLEKNLGQIKARGKIAGGFANLAAGLTGGKAFTESADYEALRKSLIGPLARAISGEVGVLTDRDISRAEGLLPKATDDPKLAIKKLNNLKSLVAEKGGPKSSIIPEQKQTRNPLVDFLLGSSLNIAQDVSSGINANLTEGRRTATNTQAGELASKFEQEAMQTENMQKRKDLLTQANNIRQQAAQGAQQVSQSFSPDVTQNPLWRGTKGATEITALAGLPSLGKTLYKLPGKAKSLIGSKATTGIARTTAEQTAEKAGIKFSGDSIAKAGKEYIENDPLAKSYGEKILPSIEKANLTPTQLRDKLKVWNKAYTAAGKVGNSPKAGFFDALARAAKEQISEKTPEVAQLTSDLRRIIKTGKVAGSVGKIAGGTAVGSLASLALYQLLGLGRRN